jgi:ABC-type uncharacterized transport system substrate-binding protein
MTSVMDRRAFLGTVGLLTAPIGALAQAGRGARIGILGNIPFNAPAGAPLWGAFIDGLRELGYVDGQNITIEHRYSEGKYERLPALAAELVRLKVDVIVVPAPQNALAAKQATQTIPIVMANAGDPLESGVVASVAQPGGNVTGTTGLVGSEIVGKWLELLREAVSRINRLAILWNPANETSAPYLEAVKAAARSLRMRSQVLGARGPGQFEGAFAAMTRERADALIVVQEGVFLHHRTIIATLATRHRLPAMFGGREFVDAGGLMSYAASMRDGFRRAATYVDKILKGAKPADLPIERPTTFELVINLKTAKALGLTIPPSLLQRADQVIE